MKKKRLVCCLMLLLLALFGCSAENPEDDWGSFTAEQTSSHDGQYYAVQTVVEREGIRFVLVSVYETESNRLAGSFLPARARDFFGICWESDSYRIWIQSGDIGVLCYRFDGEKWIMDSSAERPDNIISKYDKAENAGQK